MNRVLALVLVAIAGGLCISEGAAPPSPSEKLDERQLAQWGRLVDRLSQAREEGAFARAAEIASQMATLMERWQGNRHWQTADARVAAKRYQALSRLPEKQQQELAKSFRLEAAGLAQGLRHKYQEADTLHRQALAIRLAVLGEEGPDTARSYNSLARNLDAQGKYAAARPFHAKALAICRKVLGEQHLETAGCYNNTAANLSCQAKYAEAQPLYEKALAIVRATLGEQHTQTATGYYNLAVNLNALGKSAESLALSQKALDIHRKVQGEEHPDTAACYSIVALNLHTQGKYGAALPLLVKALAIRSKALGAEHPDTAESYNNLGFNLDAQGKYAAAYPLYEKALVIRRKVLGEEHPLTVAVGGNMAVNLNAQGKYGQAQLGFEKVLAIRRKVLGEEHPDTAVGYYNLAANLNAQGKNAEALPLSEKALAIWRKLLGEEHEATATGYNSVAVSLNGQGKYAEAHPAYERALAIRRKGLGEEHPKTANSYNNMGFSLNSQGKFEAAQPFYEKALAIWRKTLGEKHPNTAYGYYNVAMNLKAQGKHALALPFDERALAIRRNALGEEHPNTASSYDSVAANLAAQGNHAEAQPLLENALSIFRKVFGEEHPRTATAYANLAANSNAQGRYVEAQPLYEKALAIFRKAHGERHLSTAKSYNNVAFNLAHQGKHAEALPLLEKGHAIRLSLLGEKHSDTAGCYNNLAFNLMAQGKRARAQALSEKALAIWLEVLGEQHPHTAIGYNHVASLLEAQGKHAEALPLLEKALAINRNVLGEHHPYTAASYNHLALNLRFRKKVRESVRLLQESLPGQEVGRVHSSGSGFDRAVATRRVSPHVLLALGLAHLGEPGKAFRHAEASLSRGLLDDLAVVSADDARQAASLRAHLERIDGDLLPLFGLAKLSLDQKALRENLLLRRQRALSDLAALAGEASARQLLSLADIQKQLPADAALVLWLDIDILDEHYACVVRTKGDPVWVRLPGTGADGTWTWQDRDLAERLHRSLERPIPPKASGQLLARQQLSAALREQRLARLGRHLDGVRHLLVVPTGWVGRVPLEALDTGYRISYVPSGSVYARLKQNHRPVEGSSLLALGDPVFTTSTARRPEPPAQGVMLTLVQPVGNAGRAGLRGGDVLLQVGRTPIASLDDLKKALSDGGSVRFWREGEANSVNVPAGPLGVGVDLRPVPKAVAAWREAEASPLKRGPAPVPLPGTRWEVQALSRLVPKTIALLGSEASEQRLDELARDGKLKTFRLVHLATHGAVDRQTPGRSRLELARDRLPDPRKQAELKQKVYTGELTVAAIRRSWDLDADLVVLSACKTGLGHDGRGDGLLGFAQAFLQCGARCVVLSRWEVDDTATALFMLRFYENVLGAPARKDLKRPLPRAEALDEARAWLRGLSRREAETLASALVAGKLSGTRGTVEDLNIKERPVKLPVGERPYADPFFWAAFVLVGDPD